MKRYDAVLMVIRDGVSVSEAAQKVGVPRQSPYAWMARYDAEVVGGHGSRHPPESPSEMRLPTAEARAISCCHLASARFHRAEDFA